MGTRTYSRRRVDGTRVLTRLGRERAGEARTEAVVPIESNIRVVGEGAAVDIAQAHRQLFSVQKLLNTATSYQETGVLFDENGNQVKVIRGETDFVPLKPDDWKAVRGGAITHNHPLGTSLSMEDIVWAAINNDTTVQAVGRPLIGTDERVNEEIRKSFEMVADRMERDVQNGVFDLSRMEPVIADAIRNAPQALRDMMANGTRAKVTTVPRMTDVQVRKVLNSVLDDLNQNTQWANRRGRNNEVKKKRFAGYVRGEAAAEALMGYLSSIRSDMAQAVLHTGNPSVANQLLSSFNLSGFSTQDVDRIKYAISTNLVSSIFEGVLQRYNIPYAISYEPV